MPKSVNDKLAIFGCGGHARSLADVALANGVEELIFIDANAKPDEKQFGFNVVTELLNNDAMGFIVALGDNQQRAVQFNLLKADNKTVDPLIANDAYIGKNATIAAGVFVGHGAHIGPNTIIGDNTIINTRCLIEHDCVIGKHSHISVNTTIAGKCRVGDFVMIGAGATVIDGVSICSYVIVGSGAVVVDDIVEPGTYVGVPARKIK